MASGNQLKLLGTPSLLDADGQSDGFRTRKQLALLVYLALEARERPVAREVLIDLLWADVPENRGRHSLSQGLTAIREKLGCEALTRGGAVVRLTCELETDLDGLLAGALTPEIAQPLDGLEACGSAAFSHWVDGARVRCRKAIRQHLLEQVERARSRGDVCRVQEQAARLYSVDPLSDTAAQALTERILFEGDTVGAIRFLRAHVARTRMELACNPHPDLERLLRRLETGRVPKPVEEHRSPTVVPSRPEVFVGRERELAQLEASWTEARAGQLKTFLVTGPAGIGKSSLVRRFATSVAARAWPVHTVTCQEIGHGIPFAAVSDLIYTLSHDPAVSGTDPVWLAEASRVTPGLRAAYPGIPEPQPAPAESVRLRVGEALQRMLEAVADGGPALLVFDDIQHMDPASRDVLHVLLRRIEAVPILLLASVRTEEHRRLYLDSDEGHSGFSWHTRVNVPPLKTAQSHQVIATLCSPSDALDQSLRTKIAELAQGNPYLIEMLLSDWQHDPVNALVTAEIRGDSTAATWRPPETMRKVFARQYGGLSPYSERLVNLLAVAGRAMATSEIESLVALDSTGVEHAAFEVIDRGIVRLERAGFGFKNELHRAFVYYVMSHETRKYHHRQIAIWLRDKQSRHVPRSLLEASHHFARADMFDKAVEAVIRGAHFALDRGAAREAERALGLVLSTCKETATDTISLLLARALAAQGKYQDALNTLHDSNPARLSKEDELECVILRAEVLHRGRLSDDEAIMAAANAAVQMATESNNEAALMRAIQIRAEATIETSNLEGLREIQYMARGVGARTAAAETRALAQLTEGYCMLVTGNYPDAAASFSQCAPVLEQQCRDTDLRRVLNGLGMCLMGTAQLEEAIAVLHRAIAVAERIGDADACANSWSNLGVVYDDQGRFAAAASAHCRALRYVNETCNPRRSAEVCQNVASLAITLGSLDEAHNFVERTADFARKARGWRLTVESLLLEADYHLAMANREIAWSRFEEAEHTAHGRLYLLSNLGRYERLRRHYAWSTQGFEAMCKLASQGPVHPQSLQLADWLEVRVFEEWVAACEGAESVSEPSAVEELIKRNLMGVLATLVSLGVQPCGTPNPLPGESSAQLVSRVFPSPERQHIPQSVLDAPRVDG